MSSYSQQTDLPRWAADILAAVPARGAGLNRWFLRAAIALRRCGRDEHEIAATLQAATADQPVRPGELERAVERSAQYMSDNGAPTRQPHRPWPAANEPLRRKVIEQAGPIEVCDLWERSPYRLTDDGPDAEALVDRLFPGNPLLCCAASLPTATTRPREEWRGQLHELQFVVPSAMSASMGRTREGKESARCLENTGKRRYLVVEQDSGTLDEQSAVLLHLASQAPLALALTSGGKSLHGWFAVKNASEDRLRAFFGYAVSLCADPATWCLCQMVRMPEGTRDNGRRQAVLYLNEGVLS